MDWLSSNSISITQKTLDNLWQSQRISLENIANAETPNYKAKYVTFEDELRSSLNRVNRRGTSRNRIKGIVANAIENGGINVHTDNSETTRADNNNVDLDSEYVELARNQLQYQYAVKHVTSELSRIRTAIEG